MTQSHKKAPKPHLSFLADYFNNNSNNKNNINSNNNNNDNNNKKNMHREFRAFSQHV